MPHETPLGLADRRFVALPASLQGKLEQAGESLTLKEKETEAVRMSDERAVVVVSRGCVKLVAHVGPDREQVVAFGFPGEVIALPLASHTPYELHALTDCQLFAFRTNEFATILNENEQTASLLLAHVTSALDRSREGQVVLGRMTAQERVANFLLDMAERIGKSEGGGANLALPMSRRDIADSLGLTIETISRQLSQLRARGTIRTVARSGVLLLNLEDMERLGLRAK